MSGGAPRTDSEPVWTFFLFIGVLVFIGWLVWVMFRIQLLEFVRYLRLGELWIIGLFTDQQAACYAWLKQAPLDNVTPTYDNIRAANGCFGTANLVEMMPSQAANYYALTGQSIGIIGHRTAQYLHIPLSIIFTAIALYAVFISPRNKYKKYHTLESLIQAQSQTWPVISPIVNFKPASLSARVPGTPIPDKLPAFAEPLSPEEWIAWNRVQVTNGIPEREAVRRAFIQQLGPRWQGIEGQQPYMRALFAAFALKGTQKREESDDLLGRISRCWTIGKGLQLTPELASEIDRIIRDPELGGMASKAAARHAYRTTATLGALKWARSMGGVLASAQFLWLRAVDRSLWYPLNNLGRRSFHVEGSGAIAHFMAEENAKKPLPIPRVDTAIVALNQFLADPEKHPMPIPSREEPNVKT